MVFITGDTHGDVGEFSQRRHSYKLSEDDVLIITKDFGFDWDDHASLPNPLLFLILLAQIQ